MHAQYFVVNQGCHRQLFENVHELLEKPAIFLVGAGKRQAVLAFPLKKRLIETVDVGKTCAFMVSSQ